MVGNELIILYFKNPYLLVKFTEIIELLTLVILK